MALNTFYRLSQTGRPPMLMVRAGRKMRMKDDNCSLLRIARTVQAPIVTGVIGFDGYIVDVLVDDGKIVCVQRSQFICIKHRRSPSFRHIHSLPLCHNLLPDFCFSASKRFWSKAISLSRNSFSLLSVSALIVSGVMISFPSSHFTSTASPIWKPSSSSHRP